MMGGAGGGSILRQIITKLTIQADPAKLAQFQGAMAQAKEEAKSLSLTVAGIAVSAGVAAAGLSALGREGADAAQIDAAYKELGGTLEDLEKFKGVTAGLVSDTDLKKAMNLGKLFNLPAKQIPDLMKIAQGSAVALGTSVSKNLEDVFTAMARGSVMIADNLGTQMGSVEDINEAYAKQNKLNAKTLTDEQKKAAFVEAFVAKSQRQLKLAEKATQNTFALADAAAKNLRGVFADMAFRLSSALLKGTIPTVKKFTDSLQRWWQSGNNADRAIRRVLGALKLISTVLAVIVAIKFVVFLKFAVMMTVALVQATWAAVAALGAVNIALMAIPILLATIALLVEDIIVWAQGGESAIGRFIDKFAESDGVLGRLARWLRDHKDQLVAGAVAIAGGFFWFLDQVKAGGGVVLGALKKVWVAVTGFFGGGAKPIIDALGAGIAAAFGALWDWIKSPFVALGQKFGAWFDALMQNEAVARVVGALREIWGAVASIAGSIWKVISSTVQALVTAFAPLWPSIKSLFAALWQLAKALVGLALGIAQIIWAVWSTKGKVIWAVIKAVWPHVYALFSKIMEVAVAVISRVAEVVAQVVTWIAEKTNWFVDDVVAPVVAWIGNAIGWFAGKVAWLAEKVAQVIGWLAGKVAWLAEKVGTLVGWVVDGIAWLVARIVDGINILAKGLAWILDTFITPAINWLTKATEWLTGIFSDIAEGIKGTFQTAFDAVMKFAQPVIDLIDSLKGTVDWAAEKLGLAPSGSFSGDAVAGIAEIANGNFGVGGSGQSIVPSFMGGGTTANSTNVEQLQINIQGSTNMGPADLSRATQQGVEAGLTKTAGRDLSVGDAA